MQDVIMKSNIIISSVALLKNLTEPSESWLLDVCDGRVTWYTKSYWSLTTVAFWYTTSRN